MKIQPACRLIVATLAWFILTLPVAAQDGQPSLQEVLTRYAGATANSPTVDRELAQRMFRRGNTYSNLERHEEAVDEFEKAVAADPGFAEAHRNLANTLYFLQRFDEAKPHYARFLALTLDEEPNTAIRTATATMGELERQIGNFDEAIAFDLRSIALDPDNDSQIHIMGNTYNNAGDTDKAMLIYQAGIQAQPDNAFFNRTLGRLLEQEGRLEEALAQYELAVEKDPESDFYADLVENLRGRLAR